MKRILITIAMLFIILMIPLSTVSFGAVIIIPDNYSTIQAGIDAAVNGDTVLVRNGIYPLTAAIDFKGKAITVRSERGASNCILDGQNETRVVYFHSDEGSNSVLQGFTIRNGNDAQGAGIYLGSASPTITSCIISANGRIGGPCHATYGGGIYSDASSPKISNCIISGNWANDCTGYNVGGGVFINGGYPIIDHSVITDNQASGGNNALGGGIYVDHSSPVIRDSDISNNSTSSVFTGLGGGIYFTSTTFPSLVNCIINGNSANKGGGIYFDGSPNFPGLANCTIVRNIATQNGGGIYFVNTSTDIWNSILWENSPENIYKDAKSNPNIIYSDVGGGDKGTGNIDASPAFVNIALPDFHLTSSSPCVNAGSNAAPYLPAQDKDGNPRKIGSSVDMGAYEYSSPLQSFFPQVAVGGGYSTLFTVTNVGATAASGNLILTDPLGNFFVVNGELTDSSGTTLPVTAGSSFAFNIPTGGTIFLSAAPLNSSSSVNIGWARLESTGGSLTAVATYEYVVGGILQTRVGVLNSQPLQFATIPVDFDNTQGKQMVYALSNPSEQTISIKMALIGQDGAVIDDTLMVTLPPGQQIASYLSQDTGRTNFKGSLVFRGQNGATFVAVALEYKQNLVTLIPLISGKAPGVLD
jgi:hypothetical protein